MFKWLFGERIKMAYKFYQSVSVMRTPFCLWVYTEIECGISFADYAAGHLELPVEPEPESLGVAILSALAKSREVTREEHWAANGNMHEDERHEIWENEQIEKFNLKSRRAIYSDMSRISVMRMDEYLVFSPTKRDRQGGWEGYPRSEKDQYDVKLPVGSSPVEIGEAALLAFSRCREYRET